MCGGQSRRMGQPKHLLKFGDESILQRTVRTVAAVAFPIVVVGAPGQKLPPLAKDVQIVTDTQPYQGPLVGLVNGLVPLRETCDAVYLTGCDTPLLKPSFIRRMIATLGDHDAAVPSDGDFLHPLAGVYRVHLLGLAQQLIAAGQHRPRALLEGCRARRIPIDELRGVDPQLDSLRNMNHPEDYAVLLAEEESRMRGGSASDSLRDHTEDQKESI